MSLSLKLCHQPSSSSKVRIKYEKKSGRLVLVTITEITRRKFPWYAGYYAAALPLFLLSSVRTKSGVYDATRQFWIQRMKTMCKQYYLYFPFIPIVLTCTQTNMIKVFLSLRNFIFLDFHPSMFVFSSIAAAVSSIVLQVPCCFLFLFIFHLDI